MKPLHSLTLTLLVCLLLVRLPAKAAIVQDTDPRFGPNSLTIDTSTQLAWLEPAASVGLSYNQVLADTAPGGIFSGYRYATTDEVLGLFASAGIPGNGQYPTNNEAIQSLISLLGPTQVSGTLLPVIYGITGSSYFNGTQPLQYIAEISYAYNPAQSAYDYVVSDPAGGFGRGTSSPQYGNWLVMEVPEPSACSMTIGALIGLAFVKRCKKGSRSAYFNDQWTN